MKGNLGSIALVLIGIVALAVNLDFLDINYVQLIRTWWPLLLIALGIAMYFTSEDGGPKKP